ncbi:putative disease resistance protein [Nicotiana attenuata]|uniref:Disease resistance protein n=1 Tax=Nicotiana attenuata TaxID=49451 RepID=A0A1J6IDR9_NICAT|nr:putative disease resistance protein [Nicotiana attenuata]
MNKILQKIYNQVIGSDAKFSEDFVVGDKLQRELCRRRYLIVLDDLWDIAAWDDLTRHFPEFMKGSRVILTSRMKEVALYGKRYSDPLSLRLLRLEESWELLERKVIQFSYDHLSDHLKPCLLYLASYPKDEYIEISELKDLWSAEGLVEQTEMKSVEEVVEVYLDELLSNSLVIVCDERGRSSSCGIHDLVHDFCLLKARKEKLFDFISSSAPYSLLNEIGMLVHLRCLKIQMKLKALPPSFLNLLNLETLVVDNQGSNMVLSPSIWSLVKLQHVSMDSCSVFDLDTDEPTVLEEDLKLENLRILYGLKLSSWGNREDIFKRFPNLGSLTFTIEEPWPCSAEQICFPRLDILDELEVYISVIFNSLRA